MIMTQERTPTPSSSPGRPESVQAAFEVFAGKPDTGPHATAMFRYIESLEAALKDSPVSSLGWIKVPAEPPLELLKSINIGNQVLVYENGRYYNAWFEFEQSEGGWFWRDDADSEPNPSHYRPLMEAPADV